MPKVPCRDKFYEPLPDLNITQSMTNTINAAKIPGRLNPWLWVILPINGVNRPTYVKLIDGVTTEAQIVD